MIELNETKPNHPYAQVAVDALKYFIETKTVPNWVILAMQKLQEISNYPGGGDYSCTEEDICKNIFNNWEGTYLLYCALGQYQDKCSIEKTKHEINAMKARLHQTCSVCRDNSDESGYSTEEDN